MPPNKRLARTTLSPCLAAICVCEPAPNLMPVCGGCTPSHPMWLHADDSTLLPRSLLEAGHPSCRAQRPFCPAERTCGESCPIGSKPTSYASTTGTAVTDGGEEPSGPTCGGMVPPCRDTACRPDNRRPLAAPRAFEHVDIEHPAQECGPRSIPV